jgi:hypothetical protein
VDTQFTVVSGEPDEAEQRILSDLVTEIKQKKFSIGLFRALEARMLAATEVRCYGIDCSFKNP